MRPALLPLLPAGACCPRRPGPPATRSPRRAGWRRPNVLPLALDDRYQFRKVEEFLNDPKFFKPTIDPMIQFERTRPQLRRRDHTWTAWSCAAITTLSSGGRKAPGPVTVRFEYRQANLGSYVQAQELSYETAKGAMEIQIQGHRRRLPNDGRVISWRAVLIADGQIVGLTQSYLWD